MSSSSHAQKSEPLPESPDPPLLLDSDPSDALESLLSLEVLESLLSLADESETSIDPPESDDDMNSLPDPDDDAESLDADDSEIDPLDFSEP